MRHGLLLTTGLLLLAACHKAGPSSRLPAHAAAASLPPNGSPMASPDLRGVSLPAPMPPPLPDVEFTREYEEEPEPEVETAACGFQMGESFSYRGRLYFQGRPFAAMDTFGKISWGGVVAEEGRLFARTSFSAEHARVTAEVHLPELTLHAVGPIVRAEYMQIQRTRIATRTSVKGAFFAPDIQLPSNVKLVTPLREDYRIPCSFVSANEPETSVSKFDGSLAMLSAPDKVVGLSLTPDGPPVAQLVHPENLGVGVLGMYKTTALVSVDAHSDASSVTLVGWIHEGTLDDGGSGLQGGNVGLIGHPDDRTRMDCSGVPVFVSVAHKLHRLVEVQDEMTFYGALAKDGDFRVDLGGDDAWSAKTPPKDGASSPLDPFIPKEYLARCTPQ